ncbi:MAG TPA: MoaD/ThiS family protein [Actinomycetota bacterium]|jgi:sulfur carrier protein
MKVKLRNPDRVVEVSGPSTVAGLLHELDIVPEAVLVIRDATLLTRDERVGEDDEIEVRPVLSGGSDASSRILDPDRPHTSPQVQKSVDVGGSA